MLVQPNFTHTKMTTSWRCQCPHNGQTAPTRLYTWLWQARAHHYLTHRLHVFHTCAPQPLYGPLEWLWWLREQGHLFWHVTKHVHLSTHLMCDSGQPICELVVAMIDMVEHHFAPELLLHLHNMTKPREQIWLARLGPACTKIDCQARVT